MLDQVLNYLNPAAAIALIAWGELRLLPVAKKILARVEQTDDGVKVLLRAQGLTAMSDSKADELAESEVGSLKPALTEAAQLAAQAITQKKGA